MAERKRCSWCLGDPLLTDYHDREWGVPVHDDRRLFEMLNLEGAQAGLSWRTVLARREGYRRAFDDFDAEAIARYDEAKIAALLADPGIIRNRQKVRAVVDNAVACLRLREESGGLAPYLWSFVGGRTIVHRYRSVRQVPATSRESDALARDLARRGFRFVGSTICYAFMQAVGMVDDHLLACWRRQGR